MQYKYSAEEILKAWIKNVRDGLVSEAEMPSQIYLMATRPQFFNHLNLIPPDLLEVVKEAAKCCASHPEDFISGVYGPNHGPDDIRKDREEREEFYWAHRRLYEVFHPDQPLPEFVPIVLAGVVKDVTEIDGVVVVFGVRSWLIRRNPIHLVRPDGSRMITHAIDEQYIKRECDNDSPDRYHREFGQKGLFLADNVRSIDDAPIGTEVWIDRTNAPPIPPRPADL
jgi:hypothetical protein